MHPHPAPTTETSAKRANFSLHDSQDTGTRSQMDERVPNSWPICSKKWMKRAAKKEEGTRVPTRNSAQPETVVDSETIWAWQGGGVPHHRSNSPKSKKNTRFRSVSERPFLILFVDKRLQPPFRLSRSLQKLSTSDGTHHFLQKRGRGSTNAETWYTYTASPRTPVTRTKEKWARGRQNSNLESLIGFCNFLKNVTDTYTFCSHTCNRPCHQPPTNPIPTTNHRALKTGLRSTYILLEENYWSSIVPTYEQIFPWKPAHLFYTRD